MRTQTKCTLVLSGLFILELLPVPFTAVYSLYVIRKRPEWLPGAVERLYADKEIKRQNLHLPLAGHDPMVTRKRCTLSLSCMFLLDIATPFTILFSLYIVRRRPIWFKNVVARLYADKMEYTVDNSEQTTGSDLNDKALQEKYLALQQSNIDFALKVAVRTK
ncbi:MAG: hypothetical protein L3J75_02475 [Methylococcaceae bacterium]|nr:hypothetical protein [Methylococcaceae bacterium]